MNQTPFFSIIVVSLNAESTIKVTMESVMAQSCRDFEVIVKDGLSEDATLSFVPQDERVKVFSRKDRSVYDGMNQAVEQAAGKYLIFMNCGDSFAGAGVLEKTRNFIGTKEFSGAEMFYGDYQKDGKVFRQNPHVDRRHLLKEGLCHQSVFFGRELFEKFGSYNTDFRICADYEIMTRFFMNGAAFLYLDFPVCAYLGGGISEKAENIARVRAEGNWVRKTYFSCRERFLYQCQRIIRRLQR